MQCFHINMDLQIDIFHHAGGGAYNSKLFALRTDCDCISGRFVLVF